MRMRDRHVRKGIAVWENGEDSFLYMPGRGPRRQRGRPPRAERVLDGAIERRRDRTRSSAWPTTTCAATCPRLVERLRKEGVRSRPEPRARRRAALQGRPGHDRRAGRGPGRAVRRCGQGRPHRRARHRVTRPASTLARSAASTRTGPCRGARRPHAPTAGSTTRPDTARSSPGIINRLAPAAQITARQVLLSDGWGDEATIAAAIAEPRAAAGHHQPLARRLHAGQPAADRARRTRCSRCRARRSWSPPPGNAEPDVPFWPAALKQVVAVAAVDDAGKQAGVLELRPLGRLRGARATTSSSTFPTWTPASRSARSRRLGVLERHELRRAAPGRPDRRGDDRRRRHVPPTPSTACWRTQRGSIREVGAVLA